MSKLVAYFSASGITEAKAKELAKVIGAELYEIAPAVRYTSADLDWRNKKSRSSVEMNDKASRPALEETEHDFSAYDVIYIAVDDTRERSHANHSFICDSIWTI